MCGLTGVYSKSWGDSEYELFQRALMINVMRGEHSTGVIRVGEKGKVVNVRKSLLPSPAFIHSEGGVFAKKHLEKWETPIVMLGHTRHATKGEITLANAHPFSFDNVTGMHNGTIHKDFAHRKEYGTDSEALYRNINDNGLEVALNEVEDWDTAYALQFIDKKNGTLNFIKNNKRPLWFTYVYGSTTLIWSSEKEMLDYVIRSKKLTPLGYDGNKTTPFFSLDDYTLMSIKLGEPAKDIKFTPIEVKKKYAAATTTTTYSGTSSSTGSTTQQTSNTTPAVGFPMANLVHGDWSIDKGQWVWSLLSTSKHQTGSSKATTTGKKERKKAYRNFKDMHEQEELKRLSWMKPTPSPSPMLDSPKKKNSPPSTTASPSNLTKVVADLFDQGPTEDTIIDFSGTNVHGNAPKISTKEFRYRLHTGSFCGCQRQLNLDDIHQLSIINSLHWLDRASWACDDCFNDPVQDWIKMTFTNDWS